MESILVAVIVAGVVFLSLRSLIRTLKGRGGCSGCGSTGCEGKEDRMG